MRSRAYLSVAALVFLLSQPFAQQPFNQSFEPDVPARFGAIYLGSPCPGQESNR